MSSSYPQPNYGLSTGTLNNRQTQSSFASTSHSHQNQHNNNHEREVEEVNIQIGQTALDFNEDVSALRKKVKQLKRLTNTISEESSVRSNLIDTLSQGFDDAQVKMKAAKKELEKVYRQARKGHMVALVLFSVLVFLFLYLVWKANKFVRWFLPKK